MGRVNRRIGKSSETANVTADGTGGGVLDGFLQEYFNRSGNVFNAPGLNPSGLTATGGVISDYTDPGGDVYRAHIFTSSGTFNVTDLGNIGSTVEYLVVAGGGGGGWWWWWRWCWRFRRNPSGHPLAGGANHQEPGPYTVTIGAGGTLVNRMRQSLEGKGADGGQSVDQHHITSMVVVEVVVVYSNDAWDRPWWIWWWWWIKLVLLAPGTSGAGNNATPIHLQIKVILVVMDMLLGPNNCWWWWRCWWCW